eukprot:7378024-Prymnesium_polylepis.1
MGRRANGVLAGRKRSRRYGTTRSRSGRLLLIRGGEPCTQHRMLPAPFCTLGRHQRAFPRPRHHMAAQPSAGALFPPTTTGRVNVHVDHFRFVRGAPHFGLRYAAYDATNGSSAAPVLFYCGNEGALETFYNNTGALFTLAGRLRAHAFFVEHRYYGASLPFGNASFSNEALQHLSIEQALGDYAAVITSLPKLI